ncbi:hypothetical protein C6P45_004317 [Maudiozyma exigua]|uniref:Uncharacterized protein n=1 Tax=Maudiozyma exigua TaxID=34358 RepID=A0A9P6WAK3_MAUEX|nr:hypothetical protein C6P45_004317 [Kazachstania exigua]
MSDSDISSTDQEEDILFDRFISISENNDSTSGSSTSSTNNSGDNNDNTTIHRIHINNGNRPRHLVTRGNIEFRRTLGDIINTLEVELERQNNNEGDVNRRREEPRFVPRRSIFASMVRHLLVLDYFVMIVLFPFSFYNILRSGFSSVTLSENDFIAEIMIYLKYGRVLSDSMLNRIYNRTYDKNIPISLLGYSDDAAMGLLGKFHNIIVYYSSPIGKKLINFASNSSTGTTTSTTTFLITAASKHGNVLVRGYEIWVKISVIMTYLLYGLTGTMYLALSGFFFIFCLALTIIRRYRSVQKLLVANIVLTTSQDSELDSGLTTGTRTSATSSDVTGTASATQRERSTSPNYSTFID